MSDFDFGGKQEHAIALPSGGTLAPGETRTHEAYAKWEFSDIGVYGFVAIITIAAAIAFCYSLIAASVDSRLWPLPVGMGIGGVFWIWVLSLIINKKQTIVQSVHHYRQSDSAPMPKPQQTHRVEGVFQERRGHVTRTGRMMLDVDPHRWYAFCKDVDAGRCLFSGRAAADHGIQTEGSESEWTHILTEFHMHHYLADLGGDRAAPKLNSGGKFVIHRFAQSPPPPRAA